MSIIKHLLIYLLLIITLTGSTSLAQLLKAYELPLTKIQIRQISYSGDKNKSFADSSTGTVAGITLMSRGKNLVYYGSADVGGQTGNQSFLDGATEINSNYAYRTTSLEFGINVFPIARAEKSVNAYFNLAINGSYNNIEVKNINNFVSLPKSDQNVTAGGKAGLGLEWVPKNYPRRPKWTLYAEINYKKESGTLLKQNFDLGGIQYTFGIGW